MQKSLRHEAKGLYWLAGVAEVLGISVKTHLSKRHPLMDL